VREKATLTWEEAIRRMTGLPAARIGLAGRGSLAAGSVADIVVFDPETVGDAATFDAPSVYARGVEHVFVAGSFAVRDGVLTGERRGRVLRRGSGGAVQ